MMSNELDAVIERALAAPPVGRRPVAWLAERSRRRRQRRRLAGAILAVAVVAGFVVSASALADRRQRDSIVVAAGPSTTVPFSSTVPVDSSATAPAAVPPDDGTSNGTVVAAPDPAERGPLDFATTEAPLPRWPATSASHPPAATTGVGLDTCASGPHTRWLSVDGPTGQAFSFHGTFCPFVTLTTPVDDAVTSCAALTGGTDYARCQRILQAKPGAPKGPGSAVASAVSPSQATGHTKMAVVADADVAPVFGGSVSAAAPAGEGPLAATDNRPVQLGDRGGTNCYQIVLPEATVDGCLDQLLLESGLAYGVFTDDAGSVEVIGIVPDDVATVQIDGATLPVVANVWRYQAPPGVDLNFVVRSADGSRVASTG